MTPAKPGRGPANYVLGLLVLIYMSNYVDRIILGVLGEAIKTDLKLADWQLGMLNGLAFVVFYTVLGLPIGRLADRHSRVWLLSVCLAIWSVMTTLSGLAQNLVQLMGARIGVGIGEAGCTPAAHSLLCDLFPRERRSTAIAIYSSGVSLGVVAGSLAGGWIAQAFGWRAGLMVVGAPGLLLALLFRLTVREPARGGLDDAVQEAPAAFLPTLVGFLRDPLFVHVMLAISAAAVGIYALSTFSVPLLIRSYGLKLFAAAAIFGVCWGVAGAVGAFVGGPVTDAAGRRDRRWYAWLPGAAYAAAGPMLFLAVVQKGYVGFVVFFIVGSTLVNFALAPSVALIQNRVDPRSRASASAVVLFMTTLIGLGVGPTLVGALSDLIAGWRFVGAGSYAALCPGGRAAAGATESVQQACQAASFHGLQSALALAALFFVWAAIHYAFAARHLARRRPAEGLTAAPAAPTLGAS